MAIDEQTLRFVTSHFMTGVTIVTTRRTDGAAVGLTANAFASLSLNPPLVLVCIDNKVRCYPCFEESKIFAVNILHESQEELSRRFATKTDEKFTGVPWRTGEAGLPLLDGAIAHIECRIVQSYAGGDHTIFLGQVINAAVSGDRPLMFFRGKYLRLPKG